MDRVAATARSVLGFALGIVAGMLIGLPQAAAQVTCAPHAVIVSGLADGYGEARVAVALAAGGELVETFANLETGSWTVVMTAPGRSSCIVAAGENFELVDEPLAEGDPT